MTITAIDSSAILRLCFREGALAHIRTAMQTAPAVSVLAAVEVPCAIAARFHRGAISMAARDDFIRASEEALSATPQIALTDEIRIEAVRIGSLFLVRALDAIHLATAAVLSQHGRVGGDVVRFCTADLRQASAFWCRQRRPRAATGNGPVGPSDICPGASSEHRFWSRLVHRSLR